MSTNLLSYVNYDFDDLILQVQNRLKNTDTWKDIYRDGAGEMLIEFLCYVLNLGMYYTERRAEESYLLTAKNRESIVNLVSVLNYQPRRVSSATGVLTFSISSPLTKIVYIPKYTECETSIGTKYVTNEGAAIEKGQTSIDVNSIQGELVQKEITSDGSIDQEYLINDTSVENSSDTDNPTFRVIVDGEEWDKVSSFLYSDSTSKEFRVINEPEGTVSVVFGDDVNGKAPEASSTILIQYIRSDGTDGNVTYSDRITTLNSTIYDEYGDSVTVTVTNSDSFLGGSVAETLEEIRYSAPRVFSTGDRAVTKDDFIAILENYSSVATANVWGENEEAAAAGVSADYEMLNKVKMSVVLQEWELPGDTFKNTLSSYIYDQSMLTVKYEFVTPTFLLVIPVLHVKVATGYSLSQVQADISEELDEQFELGNTTRLGTTMKYSTILSALHDLDGVSYTSLVLEIKKSLSSSYDSSADWGAALDATDILPESARLFIDGTYVDTDNDNEDGTGNFSDAGGYTISGTINYSTGEVLVDISPAPSSVYVRYQQDENQSIVPSFNHICKLEDVDIQSIAMES